MQQIRCDVLVIGASLGGVAGAISAAKSGQSVVLLEEGDWVGGQLTYQGVCTPDENEWIEETGGTGSYLALRRTIRDHYLNRDNVRLSKSGYDQKYLNLGNCWVSRLGGEPRVIHNLMMEMLKDLPNISVYLNSKVVEADQRITEISRIHAITDSGEDLQIFPRIILEATETGDFLPLAGIEHRLGAESRQETGEPDAPDQARTDWIQPFTVPFALEKRPFGEIHTITPPDDYEELKALQKYHILDGAMRGMFGDLGWWSYRRVIDADNFDDERYSCDVAMINTASNDFKGDTIPTGSTQIDAEIVARARRASLGYVYWLQTECPRLDRPGEFGYPEFKLRTDYFDSPNGLAPKPYIRESRRIKAKVTIYEQEVVRNDSSGTKHQTGSRAMPRTDTCGIGHYWLDIHDGGTDEPCRFFETAPFQIPVGSLVPVRVKNVLAACKNLGVTHLTNGCFRLHPIEWNIGESAGMLASFCIQNNVYPAEVPDSDQLLRRFQIQLVENSVPLVWYSDIECSHPAWQAAQILGGFGIWPLGESLAFNAENVPDISLMEQMTERFLEIAGRKFDSRGELALACLAQLKIEMV